MQNKSTLKNLGLLVLRVGFSAGMLTHGWPKLQTLMAGGAIKFPDPLGIGAMPSLALASVGEFVFPILVIIGFKTRLSAIPTAITMAVAFFITHGGDPFKNREMAFVYLIAFMAIAFAGGGKFSLDGLKKTRR